MNEYFAAFQEITDEESGKNQSNTPSTLKSTQCPEAPLASSLTSSLTSSTTEREMTNMGSKRNDSCTEWELADVDPNQVLCSVGVVVLVPLVLGDGVVSNCE